MAVLPRWGPCHKLVTLSARQVHMAGPRLCVTDCRCGECKSAFNGVYDHALPASVHAQPRVLWAGGWCSKKRQMHSKCAVCRSHLGAHHMCVNPRGSTAQRCSWFGIGNLLVCCLSLKNVRSHNPHPACITSRAMHWLTADGKYDSAAGCLRETRGCAPVSRTGCVLLTECAPPWRYMWGRRCARHGAGSCAGACMRGLRNLTRLTAVCGVADMQAAQRVRGCQ